MATRIRHKLAIGLFWVTRALFADLDSGQVSLDLRTPEKSISLSGQIDTSFSVGNPSLQGFAIPSYRINLSGTASRYISYQFRLGQTREFSTALLPQLTPLEGSMTLVSHRTEEGVAYWSWKVGMFLPTFHPWWTLDLNQLPFPGVSEAQKILFLGPDLGTELGFHNHDESFQAGAGVFNGNGNFGLNTNNAKAGLLYARGTWKWDGGKLSCGFGAYYASQSSAGSLNYKATALGNGYAILEMLSGRLTLGGEAWGGSYEDLYRRATPIGGGGSVQVALQPWLQLFARYEGLSNSPTTEINYLNYFTGGIRMDLEPTVRVFLSGSRWEDSSALLNLAEIRFRLLL